MEKEIHKKLRKPPQFCVKFFFFDNFILNFEKKFGNCFLLYVDPI
jgi:hypothetical protein